jgi:hypothetical protein
MGQIKRIALTTKEPAESTGFYKAALVSKELRGNNDNVFLTAG